MGPKIPNFGIIAPEKNREKIQNLISGKTGSKNDGGKPIQINTKQYKNIIKQAKIKGKLEANLLKMMQNKANLGQKHLNLHHFSAHRFWPKIFPRTIFYIKMSGKRPKMGLGKGGTHATTVFKTGGKNDESKNSPKHRKT